MKYSPLTELTRRKELFKRLSSLGKNEVVQLLIEIDPNNDERTIMREVSLFAQNEALVRRYKYIPYMAITATREKAVMLSRILKKRGFEDTGLELKGKSLNTILDVDFSRRVSIPPNETFPSNRTSIEESDGSEEELTYSQRRRRALFRDSCSSGKPQQDDEYKDPEKENMWNLRNIGAEYLASFGSDVNVAVIDTGADYNHIEIRDRFNRSKLGYNFAENNDDPKDGHFHGTHVSGTVAGYHTGIAIGCNLFAVKVLDDRGSGSEANVIAGIEWCIKNDMQVGNMSLGAPAASKAFELICDKARKEGVLLIAAAGNNFAGPGYPAHFDSVMAVAAVDQNNIHAQFSNIHPNNNISAPGVKVFSCIPHGGYAKYSGTSMASPHVAGCAAVRAGIIWEGPDILADLIEITAAELGSGYKEIDRPVYGAGLVRVDELAEIS